jgi:hypothetical protein
MEENARPSERLVFFVQKNQNRAHYIRETFGAIFDGCIPIHPIPFFGPLEMVRILTIGLNPSSTEFKHWRCWPDELSAERLTERLWNYFRLKHPCPRPHPWFAELSEGLNYVNCSYESNAAHIDISSWATWGPWYLNERGLLDRYKKLLESEVPYITDLIKFCPDLKLVIILIDGDERQRALTAVANSFNGRIETQRKRDFAEWVWKNKKDLADLIGTQPLDC